MLRSKIVWFTVLASILVFPSMAMQVSAQKSEAVISEENGWKVIKTDIVTLMFPAGGKKPIFLWWYNEDNQTVNVVDFRGLWEYAVFNFTEPLTFKRKYQLKPELVKRVFIEPRMKDLEKLKELLAQLGQNVTSLHDVLGNLSMYIDEVSSIMPLVEENVEECKQYSKEISEYASMMQESVRSLLENTSSSPDLFFEFEQNASHHGCDVSKHTRGIISMLTSMNTLINFTREITLNISKEDDVTVIFSLTSELKIEREKILEKLSSVREELKELIEFVNDFPGPFSHLLMEMLKEHYMAFNETAESVEGTLQQFEILTSKVEALNSSMQEKASRCKQLLSVLQKFNQTLTKIEQNMMGGYKECWDPDLKSTIENLVSVENEFRNSISVLIDLTSKAESSSSPQELSSIIENIKSYIQQLPEHHMQLAQALKMEEKIKGCRSKLESRMMDLLELIGEWRKTWHPPYLPFRACEWNLTEIKPIVTEDGKEIGLSFAYVLNKVPIPRFKFAEKNIRIRCRFYYVPVTETVDDLSYNVTKAELKMDFIVSNWHWPLERVTSILAEKYNITIPVRREGLALWTNLASLNRTKLEKIGVKVQTAAENVEAYVDSSVLGSINVSGAGVKVKINLRLNATAEDERELAVPSGLGRQIHLGFLSENTTLGGYFRFVDVAKVEYPNGTSETVPVKGAYLEAGGYLRLFICYPYFNNGTLEHDPSIGVAVPETTSTEASTPQYIVAAPESVQDIAPKTQNIKPIKLPVIGITLMDAVLIGLAVSLIALIATSLLKRKAVVNHL